MPQGCIHISKEGWRQTGKTPITIEDWSLALLLPETYRVVDVRSAPACRRGGEVWVVVVESETIPEVEGRVLPEVVPFYRREETEAELDHIETRIWDGKDWRALDEVA